MSFAGCTWLNPPARCDLRDERLQVVTAARTDFWRETHYGFTRDSGHFFARPVAGAFTAQVRIQARFETLYDQAGLMVRVDETTWLKTGIELSDGAPLLSSVLTVGRSDWATGPFDGDPGDVWMRVTVANGVVRVQTSRDGVRWPLVRLAPFPDAPQYRVGPMCCSPERAGLVAEFSRFKVGPPSGKALHDLS